MLFRSGICFFDKAGVLKGTKINRVDEACIYPLSMQDIAKGAVVYRNYNHAFEKHMAGVTGRRFIYAELLFTANDKEIVITATDQDGISITITEPQQGEPAKNEAAALRSLKESLLKSGDSLFMFTPTIVTDKVYFYPHAMANAWRRKAADKLEKKRLELYPKEVHKIQPNATPYPSSRLSYLGNVANSLARKFYERHGVISISNAFELIADTDAALMTTRYCIRHELDMCSNKKVAENAESLYLYNNGKRLRVDFDCKRCGMTVKNDKSKV